jgi:hypothetical protein
MNDARINVNLAVLALREHVLASPPSLERLRATSDIQTFKAEVLRIAAELNLEITAADVEHALQMARRECIESWG